MVGYVRRNSDKFHNYLLITSQPLIPFIPRVGIQTL